MHFQSFTQIFFFCCCCLLPPLFLGSSRSSLFFAFLVSVAPAPPFPLPFFLFLFPSFAMSKKREQYVQLLGAVVELLKESRHWVTNTANVSALVYHELQQVLKTPVNWVGFYLKTTPPHDHNDVSLFLGPFQGEVACVAIPHAKGVCGAAAKSRLTVVSSFPSVPSVPFSCS